MIAGIILIFAVPMVAAALLISPTAFHNLIRRAPLRSDWSRSSYCGVADFPDRVRRPEGCGYPIRGSHHRVGGWDRDGRRRLQPSMRRGRLFSNQTRTKSHCGFPSGRICSLYVRLQWCLGCGRTDLAPKVAVGGALATGTFLFLAVATLVFWFLNRRANLNGLQHNLIRGSKLGEYRPFRPHYWTVVRLRYRDDLTVLTLPLPLRALAHPER
jgi:hypothetical protein